MSVSAFYRNFQAVTAMSPIQFQKQIRLQEARLLLATHPNDVTGVGHRVGYDSPSQFSREYRRQFGAPPSQDAARLRGTHPSRGAGGRLIDGQNSRRAPPQRWRRPSVGVGAGSAAVVLVHGQGAEDQDEAGAPQQQPHRGPTGPTRRSSLPGSRPPAASPG